MCTWINIQYTFLKIISSYVNRKWDCLYHINLYLNLQVEYDIYFVTCRSTNECFLIGKRLASIEKRKPNKGTLRCTWQGHLMEEIDYVPIGFFTAHFLDFRISVFEIYLCWWGVIHAEIFRLYRNHSVGNWEIWLLNFS